jgi:hypothetical protein
MKLPKAFAEQDHDAHIMAHKNVYAKQNGTN